MSTKDDFIIEASAKILGGMMGDIGNGAPSAEKAVDYAEELWGVLEKRGYVSDDSDPMPMA